MLSIASAYCLPITAYCLLPTAYVLPTFLLPILHYLFERASLPQRKDQLLDMGVGTVHCPLFTARCPLPPVYCLLSTVY